MKSVSIALSAVAMATAGPVWADAPANDGDALVALKLFASCAVQRTPEGAEKLLTLDPNGKAYGKAANAYARGHAMCLHGNSKLKFASLPFAGFLAEALIARAKVSVPANSVSVPAISEGPGTLNWIEAVGGCVAKPKPAEVAALFETLPASQGEVNALNPTGEALQACISEGQTLTLNRTAVRAMYALGVYRQSHPLQSKSEG
ncbi:hypothetical protein B2G71_08110 [Novosphingobium sp. PC22D]|uniref:hypothetical protein n=1 Tax=Novosphingobium sp. PC22D TaxID=1962403 RepID=UPI000BEFDA70|nr:hypothetical protein [Novosphingobium sp. PC22D]PEQ13382.1 hypothetical protein B2G71_08110 [Novosphingobium sp. PC22D]